MPHNPKSKKPITSLPKNTTLIKILNPAPKINLLKSTSNFVFMKCLRNIIRWFKEKNVWSNRLHRRKPVCRLWKWGYLQCFQGRLSRGKRRSQRRNGRILIHVLRFIRISRIIKSIATTSWANQCQIGSEVWGVCQWYKQSIYLLIEKIEYSRKEVCGTCKGSKAKPGTKPQKCSTCQGTGFMTFRQGMMMLRTTCTSCNGEGVKITSPCETCKGVGI